MTAITDRKNDSPQAIARIPAEQRKSRRLGTLLALIIAIAYAGFLTDLPLDVFKDRANYLVYASSSEAILNRYAGSNLSLIFNEPLWLYINIFLSDLFYPEDIIRLTIFFPAFITAYVVFKNDNNENAFWIIVILILPHVVKNNIIHLRQGLAIAFFIAGYYSKWKYSRIILISIAPLIHSSFFIIYLIWGVTYVAGVIRLSVPLRVVFFTGCYAIVAVVLLVVASNLGARQAILYESIDPDVSGFGFVFWSLILILFLSAGADFVRRFALPISILTFYLVTYFAVPFSARILEGGLLLILIAGLALDAERKLLFLTLLTTFTVLSYVERLGQPWLGWAA